MFQVVENTPDRLVLKFGLRPFQATTATFDRSTRRARFERTMFFWNRKPIEVSFDDIESISIVQTSAVGAQGTRVQNDNPVVQLRSGKRFWLSDAGDLNNTAAAVEQMRAFVGAAPTPSAEGAAATPAAASALTEQPLITRHPSHLYRWGMAALGIVATVVFFLVAVTRIYEFVTLPDCDEDRTKKTLTDLLDGKNIKLNALTDVKTSSSTKSERTCQARAEIAGGTLALDYQIEWDGWSKKVTARWQDTASLPDCDDDRIRKTLSEIFDEKKVKLNALTEVKSVSATKTERVCQARAEIPSGILALDYRIEREGSGNKVTIAEAIAEVRIDQARLDEVKRASSEFLQLARDAHTTGRPPRQTDRVAKELLDKVFNTSSLEDGTLVLTDVGKAMEWFVAGDRMGGVYILSGTGVNDISKLPSDARTQQRMHRNVADFAPEFGRYLDFQVKIVGVMVDAENHRMEKSTQEARESPEIKRELADVRSTLVEVLTGDLTSLAYDVSDEWRRERLALLTALAPRASKILPRDEARALREHALTVVTYINNPSIKSSVTEFADTISSP